MTRRARPRVDFFLSLIRFEPIAINSSHRYAPTSEIECCGYAFISSLIMFQYLNQLRLRILASDVKPLAGERISKIAISTSA